MISSFSSFERPAALQGGRPARTRAGRSWPAVCLGRLGASPSGARYDETLRQRACVPASALATRVAGALAAPRPRVRLHTTQKCQKPRWRGQTAAAGDQRQVWRRHSRSHCMRRAGHLQFAQPVFPLPIGHKQGLTGRWSCKRAQRCLLAYSGVCYCSSDCGSRLPIVGCRIISVCGSCTAAHWDRPCATEQKK